MNFVQNVFILVAVGGCATSFIFPPTSVLRRYQLPPFVGQNINHKILGKNMFKLKPLFGNQKLFEVCNVNENGIIQECEVVSSQKLPLLIGEKRSKIFLSSLHEDNISSLKEDDELIFSFPKNISLDAFGGSDIFMHDRVMVTRRDLNHLLENPKTQVSPDILLKCYGPDVTKRYPSVMDTDAARFHVHIGAGKLGMGLVMPAVAHSGVPFAVVQRPDASWEQMFKQNKETDEKINLNFEVTEDIYAHNVKFINLDEETNEMKKAENDLFLQQTPPESLIFSKSETTLNHLFKKATSLSCSIGSVMVKVMSSYLSNLPNKAPNEQPVLYCCENDHGAVAQLKALLKEKVHVIDCMVDRVCLDRFVTPNTVVSKAEPWPGSIVVLEPSLQSRLPFSSKIAKIPSSDREAEYLSKRKFNLVNGMHTVLAFLTLANEFTTDEKEYTLQKYTDMKKHDKYMVEAWRDARIAQVIEEFGMPSLMQWHQAKTCEQVWDKLLDYSDQVLVDRFSLLNDTVSRVLNGGVLDRWNQRIMGTYNWLDAHMKEEQNLRGISTEEKDKSIARKKFFRHALSRGKARSQKQAKPWEVSLQKENTVKKSLDEIKANFLDVNLPDIDKDDADAETYLNFSQQLIMKYLSNLVKSAERFCSDEFDFVHLGTQRRKPSSSHL